MNIKVIVYLLLLLGIIIVGIARINRLAVPFKIVLIFVVLTLISEIAGRILSYQIHSSSPSYHFYLPFHYGFICLIYYYLLSDKLHWIKIYCSLTFVFFLTCTLINTLYYQSILTFPSNALLLDSFFVLFLAFITFSYMLRFPKQESIFKQSIFWFNTGNFIFHISNFFFWLFFNYLLRNEHLPQMMMHWLWITNVIMYTGYGLSFYFDSKSVKSRT